MRLVAGLVAALAICGCSSTGGGDGLYTSSVQCDSLARALMLRQQLDGLSPFVLLGTRGTYEMERLSSHGLVNRVTFFSRPAVDRCTVLLRTDPYDNPVVDVYLKKNHVVVGVVSQLSVTRQEHRWRGGLIVDILFLDHLDVPALGIVELNPDQSMTRRVLFLDGRRNALEYHAGAFPAEHGGVRARHVPAAGSAA